MTTTTTTTTGVGFVGEGERLRGGGGETPSRDDRNVYSLVSLPIVPLSLSLLTDDRLLLLLLEKEEMLLLLLLLQSHVAQGKKIIYSLLRLV